MKLSIKSIALATMMTVSTVSVSTGLGLLGKISAASAQTNYAQINRQLQFQPQICAKPSIIANWKGIIVAAGDDAATYLEISIPSGKAPQQGTWKFPGESEPLDQGKAIASVQGNTVTLELWSNNSGSLKKISTLQGNFQDCGSKISGKLLNTKTNFVFNLAKF